MSTWAAVFDFDGVIVDSAKPHETCWFQVAARRQLPITREAFLRGFGMKNHRFISEVLQWTSDPKEIDEIIHEKELAFQAIAAGEVVPFVPGLLKFIHLLQEQTVPCAIGSSSIRRNIDLVLAGTPLEHTFAVTVAGGDVQHGKPNPEVFLKCAAGLQIHPEQCVVFEDAPYGIEAAKRAGMRAVALTTTFPREEFLHSRWLPDLVVQDFTVLSFDELASWF